MRDTNREWYFVERPTGEPVLDSFELRERDVPDPKYGQLLVRVDYLSVDPYMRGRMRDEESYTDPWDPGEVVPARIVGTVVESESDYYDAGDVVTGHGTWADFAVLDAATVTSIDTDVIGPAAYLGILGMPGRTAYFGMLEVGDPNPDDTVVVSGAAGAVGSTAGQIAKLNGCRVVGFAGSDEKTSWLTDDLGFDAAINYEHVEDYGAALDDAAPEGVDVYFDNVGGPITDAVFSRLNVDARVAVCGQISHYNDEEVPVGPRKLPLLIASRATVEGFLVSDFAQRFGEANARLRSWVGSGDVVHRESVVEGLENAPDAFLGLFSGDNIGKQVVSVSGE